MLKQFENSEIDESKLDIHAGRRAFLKTSGLMAAGATLLGAGAATTNSAEAQVVITDEAILNFALNLEYLEAEFYLRAAFGRGLSSADIGGSGRRGGVSVPSGASVSSYPSKLSSTVLGYAREIANDEEAHVRFLRTALGSAKVARPDINLNTSFTTAARAAGLISSSQTFNPFADDASFLLAAFIFEDVGVTAYKGAARYIENGDYLEAAAGILAVEAYHAAEVRTLIAARGFWKQADAISNARDSLDGGTERDQGIGTASNVNIVPTDKNGLAFSRSTSQVLDIVYLGKKATDVSFFPKGLNGAVKGNV